MRRTPREDREAYNERMYREYLALVSYYDTDDTPAGTGVPENHNRTYKASVDSWNYDQRTGKPRRIVGIAPGTAKTSDGTPTVLVRYANGIERVEPARGFGRGTTRVMKRDTVAPRESYQDRVDRFGADGDSNH